MSSLSTSSYEGSKILSKEFKLNSIKTVTILIVSNHVFYKELSTALQICFDKHPDKYKLSLILCEEINEILKFVFQVPADFVIFVMDTRIKTCVKDIEYSLQLMDKLFICGKTCIINGNPHIPLSEMGVSLNSINALRYKYNCILLNGNIMDTPSCAHLANRLYNLIIGTLGFKQNAPLIPWIQNDKHVNY